MAAQAAVLLAAVAVGRTAGAPRVVGLYRYPVKSARAVPADALTLGADGVAGDRRWLVAAATPAGLVGLTQRELPALATLAAEEGPDGALRLTARDGASCAVSVSRPDAPGSARAPVVARLFGSAVQLADQGDQAAGWLSHALGAAPAGGAGAPPLRLLRCAEPAAGRPAGLCDQAPLLLLAAESLAELNDRRAAAGLPPAERSRFRPNVVVEGVGAPFEEEAWPTPLTIGGVEFARAAPCPRCAVPDVSQDDGAVAPRGQGPVATLRGFRRRPTGETPFGVYLWPAPLAADAADDARTIRLGDEVRCAERAPPTPTDPLGAALRWLRGGGGGGAAAGGGPSGGHDARE